MELSAPVLESKTLPIRKCLRGGDGCCCVLCTHDLDDGIADRELREKFRRLLSNEGEVIILDIDLKGYLLAALFAMQRGEYGKALQCLQHYDLHCLGGFFLRTRPFLYYYFALVAYGLKDYAAAEQAFREYFRHEEHQKDETAYLHFGNCCFRQQKWQQALEAYGKALELRGNFPEATINIGLAAKKLGDEATAKALASDAVTFHGIITRGTLCEDPLEFALAIPQNLSIWDIPIFINSRDRVGTLQKLVEWLCTAGYRRVYILDNDSTYPPLLEYYRHLEKSGAAVEVLRLGKNMGHTALWDSGVLESLHVNTPYVYTDSDVIPTEECPHDILGDLLGILRKYPFLKKAGLALKTDDITYFDREKTREDERGFYLHVLEKDLYFSTLDTTFALYRNYRHYNLYVAARTTGKRTARHLPWYYDYGNLPEDERYYMEHANRSASLVQRIRQENPKDIEKKG